jgi:hypothetical protein
MPALCCTRPPHKRSQQVHLAVTSSIPAAHLSLSTVTVSANLRAQDGIVMTDFLAALLAKFAAALLGTY